MSPHIVTVIDTVVHIQNPVQIWRDHPTHGMTLCGWMYHIGENTLNWGTSASAMKTVEVVTCFECLAYVADGSFTMQRAYL